jgi:hypothetical protein
MTETIHIEFTTDDISEAERFRLAGIKVGDVLRQKIVETYREPGHIGKKTLWDEYEITVKFIGKHSVLVADDRARCSKCPEWTVIRENQIEYLFDRRTNGLHGWEKVNG